MKSILRILPVALALFTSPAIIIPSVVEGPGCVVVRVTRPTVASELEYHEPRVTNEVPAVTHEIVVAPTIPLRGASTPRAPAA
jgi:hypothetical protein